MLPGFVRRGARHEPPTSGECLRHASRSPLATNERSTFFENAKTLAVSGLSNVHLRSHRVHSAFPIRLNAAQS